MGVHSQPGCKLALATDQDVHLPLIRELCPFDLAPVTSTAIQMLFGDTCAVAIMQVSVRPPPPTEWQLGLRLEVVKSALGRQPKPTPIGSRDTLKQRCPFGGLVKRIARTGTTNSCFCQLKRRDRASFTLRGYRPSRPDLFAPTARRTMTVGDVPVLQAKKLTMDEYAMNHPAGRIGKRLILKVGDVMKKSDDLPISSADASLMSELVKLSSAGVGCLLVRFCYVVARGLEVTASRTSPSSHSLSSAHGTSRFARGVVQ